MTLEASPLIVVAQPVAVDGVEIMSRLADPATSHARLRVGTMILCAAVIMSPSERIQHVLSFIIMFMPKWWRHSVINRWTFRHLFGYQTTYLLQLQFHTCKRDTVHDNVHEN